MAWPASSPDGCGSIGASFDSPVPVPNFPSLVQLPVTLTNVPSYGGCISYQVGTGYSPNNPVFTMAVTQQYTYFSQVNFAPAGPPADSVVQGASWSFPFQMNLSVPTSISNDPAYSTTYTFPSANPHFQWAASSNYQGTNGVITVDPTLPPGRYLAEFPVQLEIDTQNWGGNIFSQNLVAEIDVAPAAPLDFTISTPVTETVQAGTATPFSLLISPVGGFTGTVSLAYDAVGDPTKPNTTLPGGGSITFQPQSVQLNGASQTITGTVNTTSQTNTGYYTVKINASGGANTHSAAMSVKVTGGPPLTFNVTGAASVQAGFYANFGIAGLVGAADVEQQTKITFDDLWPSLANYSMLMIGEIHSNTYRLSPNERGQTCEGAPGEASFASARGFSDSILPATAAPTTVVMRPWLALSNACYRGGYNLSPPYSAVP